MRDRQEIKKRWAQLRMPPVYQRIEKHGAAANKELPPQLPRLFQRPGAERAHAEALDLERPRRILYRLASLRRNRDKAVVLKEGDGNAPQIFQGLIPEADRRAHRIQGILPAESNEEQGDIADGACHGADCAKNGKGPIACRQMTACGNTAWRGLERAYPGKVSRFAYRAAAIAAKSTRGKAGGNGGRFAAARAAGASLHIPGIRCAPVQPVVALVSH